MSSKRESTRSLSKGGYVERERERERETGMEHEMCECTGNIWCHRTGNRGFKDRFGSHSSRSFDRSTTTDSRTWNVTGNTESAAV
jgi:hypothetical protein